MADHFLRLIKQNLLDASRDISDPFQFSLMYKAFEELLRLTFGDSLSKHRGAMGIPAREGIDRLRRVISLVHENIPDNSEKELKEVISSHGLFDNVLNQELKRKHLSYEHLSYLASYLLVTQLLLYQMIRNHQVNLPVLVLPEIQSLEDIESCLESVEGEIWNQMLTPDIISLFRGKKEREILEIVKRAVAVTGELAELESSKQLPGILFHGMIPVEMRKILAAYYTRTEAAELLAWLAIETPSTAVIDPACGSGTLLSAARRRQCDLMEKKHFGSDFDRRLEHCGPLFGMDVMPFAVKLATVILHLQVPINEREKVKLITSDATSIREKELLGDFLALEESNRRSRLVMMNPPFSRQENMSRISSSKKKKEKNTRMTYKQGLEESFVDYRKYLSGRAGLYVFFLFIADRFLIAGDKLAAVLPAGILRLVSTRKAREFLVKNYNIEYIVARIDEPAFSENTAFREVFLVARKKNKQTDQLPSCRYIILHEMPETLHGARELAEKIKLPAFTRSSGMEITKQLFECEQLDGFHAFSFTQEQMVNSIGNWYMPLATGNPELFTAWNDFQENSKLKSWKEVLGGKQNLKRGLESLHIRGERFQIQELSINDPRYWTNPGDKFLFTGKTSENVIANFGSEQLQIPMRSVRPAFRTFARKNMFHVEELMDWVICQKKYCGKGRKNQLIEEGEIKKMLSSGDWTAHVEERQVRLCHLRRVDLTAPGTAFLVYHFAEPRAPGATMWAIKQVMDEKSLKALTIWFNSSLHLLQVILNRIETRGGFLNLHEYVLEQFKVLDVNQLTEEEKTKLTSVFEEWKEKPFPSLLEQLQDSYEGRYALDDAVLEILGMKNREQRKKVARELRRGLVKEIQDLKNLMKGPKRKSQKPRSRAE